MSTREALWNLVERRLQELVSRLQTGADVAPAQRYRLEGLLEGLLAQDAADVEAVAALARRCNALLPAPSCARVVAGRIELDLWQRRAPVTPSSPD